MALVLLGLSWGVPRLFKEEQALQPRKWLIGGMSLMLLWFCAYNFIRHALFLSGYDLGTYTNILWNSISGHFMYESHSGTNFLGEHFIPASVLVAPILLLWKNAAALALMETLIVAATLPAIYFLVLRMTKSTSWALVFCLAFLVSPYLHKILTDPYRPITLCIPVFLWAAWAIESNKKIIFSVLILFSFLIQENTPIFALGLGGYLFLFGKGWRLVGLFTSTFAVIALLVITSFAMPHFFGKARLVHMDLFFSHYSGNGTADILFNILRNPLPFISNTFSFAKIGQILFFGSTVCFLCFLQPQNILLFIGPMTFYLMSDFNYMTHFSRHYSSDIITGVFYAAALGFVATKPKIENWWKNELFKKIICVGIFLLTLSAISQYPDYRLRANLEKVKEGHAMLKLIPSKASVACSRAEYYSYLAFRKELSAFPETQGYEYVYITKTDSLEFPQAFTTVKQNYDLVKEGQYNFLYKKKAL
jgi:uncharacterized membrane protein